MALDRGAELKAETRTRTSTRTVTFRRRFRLSAVEESQPAGSYQVESDEEQLATISSPAYRRIATWLRLPAPAGSRALDRLVNVDAMELESALAADTVRGPPERPAIAEAPASSGGSTRRGRGPAPFTGADWLVRNAPEMRLIAYAVVATAVLGFLMSFDLLRAVTT